MPGLFNPMRSPSSPDLLQRLFSAKQETPASKPELSAYHARILEDCITDTRTKIFKLERRIKSLNANILTVCRCIGNKQPKFSPPVAVRLADVFQTEIVPSVPRKGSPRRWSLMPLLRSQSLDESKVPDPASLIERPTNIPEAEREIAAPTSLIAENMALMVDGKADLQVQLNMLVLKQAELEVNVQKLETDLFYWGGIYEQAKASRRKGVIPKKRHSYQTVPQPALLRIDSSSSDSTASEQSGLSYMDTSTMFRFRRKEVAIKEMIKRVQATSMFPLQPSRSRGNSWSEGDDLFVTQSIGFKTNHPGPSIGFRSKSHAKEDLTRDDSAVDMSADVRRAMEELASGSLGFETR